MIYIVKTADGSRKTYKTRQAAEHYIAVSARLGCVAVLEGRLDLDGLMDDNRNGQIHTGRRLIVF